LGIYCQIFKVMIFSARRFAKIYIEKFPGIFIEKFECKLA